MGSPRQNGNTAKLCEAFIHELKLYQFEVEYVVLHGKNIAPCLGCMHCQNVAGEHGCVQHDDMQSIVEIILRADVLIYATPIYTWQATPPLKAVMDRMFALNKFYGSAPREILSKTKAVGLIATCGYAPNYGADLLDEAVKRWCKHSGLSYMGMYAIRDDDFGDLAAKGAREFAGTIIMGLRNDT